MFRTLEMLIVGFYFCKHDETIEKFEDLFFGLINPEQENYINIDKVKIFLKKL